MASLEQLREKISSFRVKVPEVPWRSRSNFDVEGSRRGNHPSVPGGNTGRTAPAIVPTAGTKRTHDDIMASTKPGNPPEEHRPSRAVDGATVLRSRRMMGSLLGHLAKAKLASFSGPMKQQQLQDAAGVRFKETLVHDRRTAAAAHYAALEAQSAQIDILAAEEKKTWVALNLAVNKLHHEALISAGADFIVTSVKPALYWGPAITSHHRTASDSAREAASIGATEVLVALHAHLQSHADAAADTEVKEKMLQREARRSVTVARAAGPLATGTTSGNNNRTPIRTANRGTVSAINIQADAFRTTHHNQPASEQAESTTTVPEAGVDIAETYAQLDQGDTERAHPEGSDDVPVDYS